ncbi:glycoside hydrolase family 88 protein [candidate division KSB1 bacterium]|nr:glycoside hydrolase family 88 protein [candidate division KSB1 bacterium]
MPYMPENDTNTPLHLIDPQYETPYEIPAKEGIVALLGRVLDYLEKATPVGLVNKQDGCPVKSKSEIDVNTIFAKGDFRITSYEWGVTYAGMLLAGDITGDLRFVEYAQQRLKMIADVASFYLKNPHFLSVDSPVHSVLKPQALDDAGALCAAMIKAEQADLQTGCHPFITNFIEYISKGEYRFADDTLVRNRPYENTLWLDDLFMSVPALAQMAASSGNAKYFDDALKQVILFSQRMFIPEKGLYMHGWTRQMAVHPQFCWGRANGWALMAMLELLSVLPEEHPGFQSVLEQFRAHVYGLVRHQSGSGFWHQLLDRNDSYLETSATSIITFSLARAINKGFIDKFAFAPIALLGWNALSTKINALGQVEGTCVGTGMGFDPAFYYHRPVNVFAAHGYGPVLLAGAEMIRLLETEKFEIVERAILIKKTK